MIDLEVQSMDVTIQPLANETIDHIVAEIIKLANDIEVNTDWEQDLLTVDHSLVDALRSYADRIMGAVGRERELLKANIARVRELEGMLDRAAGTVLACAIEQRKGRTAAAMQDTDGGRP